VAVSCSFSPGSFPPRPPPPGTKPRVAWADRKLMYTMDWPDLDHSAYLIRPEASSLDSLSPAARMQSALELAQTGWITPQQGRVLVGHPDLKAADSLDNAPETYANYVLHRLWRGEVVEVDEKAELTTLMRVIKQGRLLAITKGVEKSAPNVLAGMDSYLDTLDIAMKAAADAALQQAQMQQAAMQPAPGLSQASAQGMPAPFPGQ